jgi:hypothetical protein
VQYHHQDINIIEIPFLVAIVCCVPVGFGVQSCSTCSCASAVFLTFKQCLLCT